MLVYELSSSCQRDLRLAFSQLTDKLSYTECEKHLTYCPARDPAERFEDTSETLCRALPAEENLGERERGRPGRIMSLFLKDDITLASMISYLPVWHHTCQYDITLTSMTSHLPVWHHTCQYDITLASMTSHLPVWHHTCQYDITLASMTSHLPVWHHCYGVTILLTPNAKLDKDKCTSLSQGGRHALDRELLDTNAQFGSLHHN